ncbi:MAG: glutamate 5-kinase, partial [Firmicutes bacterium]|nr:glutamate 5-kinase [Bacillota bacterium]
DNLAAMVAGLVDAEVLILLSDVDGLYTDDPRRCPGACLIREVEEITPEIEALARGTGAPLGTGGMVTKLQAAHVAGRCGVAVVIARAGEENVILRVLAGEEVGTVFWPVTRLENRKRWIAYSAPVQGRLVVDDGAVRALERGKSLLPSGVVAVEGTFEMGNTVSIVDPTGKEVARGIVNFSSGEVEKIKGRRTSEIARILGYKDYDEVVHRNNLVLGP